MEKIDFERIASRIALIRNEKGLSKAYVAKVCDITPTTYANIEKADVSSISLDTAKGIAKALGESFNELFEVEISDNSKAINEEILFLNRRITELEEQLNDKRRIIEFLSKNNLLLAVASKLFHDENPIPKKRDFNNVDSLIKEINELPYDPGDPQSQYLYILKRMDDLKAGKKE